MKAAFTYAVCYTVTARCLTPLRTAAADGDTESVLCGSDGTYLIQGSSIAGALRAWAGQHENSALISTLFGSQSGRGSLIVSDGSFSKSAESVLRPRLRIDGKTGAASKSGKYDLAHIGKDAEFTFTVHWLGEPETLMETEAVERCLAALHRGDILIGAQKSNGYGRVSLRVTKQSYNLKNAADRDRWLSEAADGRPLLLPESGRTQKVLFRLSGQMDSLLVKTAEEHEVGGSYTPNLKEAGMPVIPGSSVKGAVRARAEWIAAYLGLPASFPETLFGRGAEQGDNGLAGRLRFEDATLEENKARKITRIRVNRFTGGVIRGGLFCEEPISGKITLRVEAPADDKAGCMLLLYALRDLALGLYGLGSGASIGRGFLIAEELTVEAPEGDSLSLRFDEQHCSVSDPAGLIPSWRQALEAIK